MRPFFSFRDRLKVKPVVSGQSSFDLTIGYGSLNGIAVKLPQTICKDYEKRPLVRCDEQPFLTSDL
jgi:hypothetical protein